MELLQTLLGISLLFLLGESIWYSLCYDPPEPDFQISGDPDKTSLILPEKEIKRQGSLEFGDTVGFKIRVDNYGNLESWMRCRFDAGNVGYTSYQGLWEGDGYDEDEYGEYVFYRTLNEYSESAFLKTKIDLEVDMYNGDSRENIFDEEIIDYFDIPILPSQISTFANSLSNIDKDDNYKDLMTEYKLAMKEYRHKDVEENLDKLQNRIEYDFL